MILILLIVYVQLFLLVGIKNVRKSTTEMIITSCILFSCFLLGITEFLSLLAWLNSGSIFISWCVISIFCFILLIVFKERSLKFVYHVVKKIKAYYFVIGIFKRLLLATFILLLIILLFQGIVYPPNNFDSMTYHMARIPHWISDSSVMHYPTHIYRQIYQPPFAEFVIMHVNLLTKSDLFSNAVQLFFLIFSVITLIGIMDQLGLGRKYYLVAAILLISIPEVILQSTSTQNDIVVSFFILSAVYYGNICIREGNIRSFVFLGLSVGLSVLTKGTAYIFLTPLLVYVAIKLLSNFQVSVIRNSLLASLIFLSINFGHFYRNYAVSDNLLGINKVQTPEEVINLNFHPLTITFNFLKNVGLHLGPSSLHHLYKKALLKIFSIDGLEEYDSQVNFDNLSFKEALYLPNHEDYGANTLHFYMIILVFLVILYRFHSVVKDNKAIFKYSLLVLSQVLLFIVLLKWTPWHSRLHTPIFILSIPIICFAIDMIFKGNLKLFGFVLTILIIQSYYVASTNYSRVIYPFHSTTSKISITDTRFKKYFATRPDLYDEYLMVNKQIVKFNNKNIGLIIGGDDWEYPLFSEIYSKDIHPIHINVTNKTKDLETLFNRKVDCIVSTVVKDSSIVYRGEVYHNLSQTNQHIYYFEK